MKVKLGVKSGSGTGRYDVRSRDRQNGSGGEGSPFEYDRWKRMEEPQDHITVVDSGRRLWVGGLPMFKDQVETNK